jgi:hypothetical protein
MIVGIYNRSEDETLIIKVKIVGINCQVPHIRSFLNKE